MSNVDPRRMAMALLVLAGVVACGEEIVYRDRNDLENPPAAAGPFMGYSDAAAKRTVCGNCHSGKQSQWQGTAHAGAWTTLVASGAQQAACEGCHTVSSIGNAHPTASVGYLSTKSTRYQDVQCESCHGPGLTHVTNPDITANKPLASLAVSPTLTRGCGECHSGAHQPFAEQWAASRHAKDPGSRGTNASCNTCHEARAVLVSWGVRSTFLEERPDSAAMAVTCAVCHDPHEARHTGQLRFAVGAPDVAANLCMKCHRKRAEPELSNRDPHSPQGPLLLGDAGWRPPNFAYAPGTLVGSHGPGGNSRLCATCHVNSYTITDKVTGKFTFRSTGHRFEPTPCVNAAGVPTGALECAITERSFRSCTGCHLNENAARTALLVARERIGRLADQVEALLARVPRTEFSTTDTRITTAEGAQFNMQLAEQKGSAIHNPFLVEALLIASIKQIEIDYQLKPALSLDLRPQLARR